MDRKYVYIRDENGKIIGRTFDPSGLRLQQAVSGGTRRQTPPPEPKTKTEGQRLPGVKLSVQWLLEDLSAAFFQYCRDKKWMGAAAAVLALLLAVGTFFSGLSLTNLLSAILMAALGAALFLQKQRITSLLFTLYGGWAVLMAVLQPFLLHAPFSFWGFILLLQGILNAAALLGLAWLAKNRFAQGKADVLWLVPTVLRGVSCLTHAMVGGIPLSSLLWVLFVFLASSWLVDPYQGNSI